MQDTHLEVSRGRACPFANIVNGQEAILCVLGCNAEGSSYDASVADKFAVFIPLDAVNKTEHDGVRDLYGADIHYKGFGNGLIWNKASRSFSVLLDDETGLSRIQFCQGAKEASLR